MSDDVYSVKGIWLKHEHYYLYKMFMLFLLTQDSDDMMSVVVSHALQTIFLDK